MVKNINFLINEIIEAHKEDPWVFKWKGNRELDENGQYKAYKFPDQGSVYLMCPLSFRNHIQDITKKEVSMFIKIDLETQQPIYIRQGDELILPLYYGVKKKLKKLTNEQLKSFAKHSNFNLPEVFYPNYLHNGNIIRKWGKEKVELFYNTDPSKAFNSYLLLRKEESIFSEKLITTANPIIKEIDNIMPGFIEYALTSGSHSQVWGGGAGNLMSWLGGDVDIDLLVNAHTKSNLEDKLNYLSQKINGSEPYDWGKSGSHKIIDIKRNIGDVNLPISGYIKNLEVRFCIFFTTMNQFYSQETEYMPFLMVNGTLIGEKTPGTYKDVNSWGKEHYPMGAPELIIGNE
tara:strand:- start:3335 stop:4372 length:1038 start_codon:yes stop_codon:yes gene_type:complete